MRNRFILLAVVVASSLVAATAAWAGFPDFQSYDDPVLVYGPQSSSALRTTAAVTAASPFSDPRVFVGGIVIADVDATVTVTLKASYRASYVCVQGGTPLGAGTTVVGHVAAKKVFLATQQHIATGSLLTPPLPSPAHVAFACPSGQTLEFNRAVFSNLVLAAHGGERIELHETLVSHPVYG